LNFVGGKDEVGFQERGAACFGRLVAGEKSVAAMTKGV